MHILHVIASLDAKFGGPTLALVGLAGAQVQAGLRVSVVTPWRADEITSPTESLRRHGVAVERVGPVSGPLGNHPRLAAVVREQILQADIVHIHGLWEQIQHVAAQSPGDKPYLFRPCGMLDPWSLNQSRWKKRIYMAVRLRRDLNHAAAIHYTTDIERDLAAPLRLKPPAIVEPNGVDLAEFDALPEPGSFRRRHHIPSDRRLVIFMSRLHHKKGLDKLIPAFGRLKDTNAMLAVVGPDFDGYQKIVEKMIADAGIKDRVFFTGMLEGADRVAALSDADLFVLPSYQENFGIAVVEALAAGTPVVISDQVNLYPDVLAAKVGGVVPLDIDLLAAEIDRWLADEPLRQTAGEAAARFARSRYDWREIAVRWKGRYERLLAGDLTPVQSD